MANIPPPITGGCQCGNIRYKATMLGRASICHCRMCQKAFGNFYGPLVATPDIVFTKGERAIFKSSNRNQRGFCAECGTPLTYEHNAGIEVSIGSLDNPEIAPPTVQLHIAGKLSFTDKLHDLPITSPNTNAQDTNPLISHQHPDQD